MKSWIVLSLAGAHRDLSKGSREQAFWDEHAAFIDGLLESGFIRLGGPTATGGAMLVVDADSEDEVQSRMAPDPWYQNDILQLQAIHQWEIFVNRLCESD